MRARERPVTSRVPGRGQLRLISDSIQRLAATPFNVELWTADLAAVPPPWAQEALSPAERSRAAGFVFETDRQRYLSAHCALAELLAQRLSLPVGVLEWQAGPHGKPLLPAGCDCVFNLSHCEDLALIGIATGLPQDVEIGVDIECLREVRDAHALAATHFTSREQAELECPGTPPSQAFLRGWTRKEACLKAIGSGLTIAPNLFDCGLEPVAGTTEIEGVTVEFTSIEIGPRHTAAIAITRPGARGALGQSRATS